MTSSTLERVLERQVFQNTIEDYLVALATILLAILLIRFGVFSLIRGLKRWSQTQDWHMDPSLIRLIENPLVNLLYVAAVYLSLQGLSFYPSLRRAYEFLGLGAITFLSVKLLISLIEYLIDTNYSNDRIQLFYPTMRTVIWGFGGLFLISNLGFNITSLIASLGIGGIAIALAAKGILEDLFSYYSILLDRPFELEDLITIDQFTGKVKYIGIKTTRLESIDGEQLIFSNSYLIGSKIRNFKRMEKRRVLFRLGLEYQTEFELLAQIPTEIQGIMAQIDGIEFDGAYFCNYGNSSLDFEIVYFVLSADYKFYMDRHQQVNLGIKQRFAKLGIEFAYPSRTLYINSSIPHQYRDAALPL